MNTTAPRFSVLVELDSTAPDEQAALDAVGDMLSAASRYFRRDNRYDFPDWRTVDAVDLQAADKPAPASPRPGVAEGLTLQTAFALFSDMLAWERERFDDPQDESLGNCGAALIDYFTEFRQRVRAVMNAPRGELTPTERERVAELLQVGMAYMEREAEDNRTGLADGLYDDDSALKDAEHNMAATEREIDRLRAGPAPHDVPGGIVVAVRDIITDLRAAAQGLADEVHQMKGMFDDEDGTTADALSDFEEADARAKAFADGLPKLSASEEALVSAARRFNPREPLDDDDPEGYRVSGADWIRANREAHDDLIRAVEGMIS